MNSLVRSGWLLLILFLMASHARVLATPASEDINLRLQKAESYIHRSQIDSALLLFEELGKELEGSNEWETLVKVHNSLGFLYNIRNQPIKGKASLIKAKKIGEAQLSPQHEHRASTTYYLGQYHYFQNNLDSAINHFNEALKMRIEIFGLNHIEVAKCYFQIGDTYRYKIFDYYQAEQQYKVLISIAETLDDDNLLFRAAYNLATTNRRKGDLENALTYGHRALNKAVELRPQNLRFIEISHGMLANIYDELERYNEALHHYQTAINSSIRLQENYKEADNLYYTNIGEMYVKLNSYKNARQSFEKALNNHIKHGTISTYEGSVLYNYLGRMHLRNMDYNAALKAFNRSLEIRTSLFGERHFETSAILQAIGELYLLINSDSALFYFQQAIITASKDFESADWDDNPSVDQIGENFSFINLISQKSLALKQKYIEDSTQANLLTQALHGYQLIDTLIDKQRQSFEREGSQLLRSAKVKKIYADAIDCLYLLSNLESNEKHAWLAYHFIEKSKARILLDELMKVENNNRSGIPDELFKEERGLRSAELLQLRNLERERLESTRDEESIILIQDSLYEISRAKQRNLEKLRSNHPQYYHSKYIQSASVIHLTKDFLQTHNAQLIDFFWHKDLVYVIGINQTGIVFNKIKDVKRLEEDLVKLQKLLTKSPAQSDMSEILSFQDLSFDLFNQLLEPILSVDSAVSEKLIVVPDGMIASIPFEVLTPRKTDSPSSYKQLSYLLTDFVISYAYSSELLMIDYGDYQTDRVLAVSFSDEAKSSSARELPGSSNEIDAIAKIMDNGVFLKGNHASKLKFVHEGQDYGILHLALHGVSDIQNPFDSHLIFKDTLGDLDTLFAYELYNLRLNAKLVVLSSCETGIGKNYAGEGVYSLARSFLFAGGRSIITSLWKIDDTSTSNLVEGFYTHLNEGEYMDESLQLAKIQYLKSSSPLKSHPVYWASMISIGRISSLDFQSSRYTSVLIGIIMLAITIMSIVIANNLKNRSRRSRI